MTELTIIQKHQKGDIRVLSKKDIDIMTKAKLLNIDTCRMGDVINTGFIVYKIIELNPLTFKVEVIIWFLQ